VLQLCPAFWLRLVKFDEIACLMDLKLI